MPGRGQRGGEDAADPADADDTHGEAGRAFGRRASGHERFVPVLGGGYRTVVRSLRRSGRRAVITWRAATEQALYGDGGFYRRRRVPPTTSAPPCTRRRCSPRPCWPRRAPACQHVVDVGSGRGELLRRCAGSTRRCDLVGVEVADRPGRPAGGDRLARPSCPTGSTALVIGNEWLDNVPVDAAVVDRARLAAAAGRPGDRCRTTPAEPCRLARPRVAGRGGGRLGERGATGRRSAGRATRPGRPRSASLVARRRGSRRLPPSARADRPRAGSLAGYRSGRRVDPVPDGSCDITSHVALDSCAAAGRRPARTGRC